MTDPRIPALDPRLRERLAALPDDVPPARDLWPEIAAELDAQRLRTLPGDAAGGAGAADAIGAAPAEPRGGTGRGARAWPLLRRAAAVLLLVGGTAVVTWDLRGRTEPEVVVVETVPLRAAADGLVSYERSADELARALEQRRAKLDPATVEAIERSLRTIDSALVEARTALERDPSSAQVRAYVEAAYRQKIDFLRRANDVASTWTL